MVFALVGWPSLSAAQEFSVKGGISSSNLSLSADSHSYTEDRSAGLTAGVSFTQRIHKEADIQIEGLVNLRDGIRADGLKLTYFEVPVLVRVTAWRPGARDVYLFGGPQFAFNLSGKSVATEVGGSVGRDIENVEWGLTLGGGVELSRLILDVRYTWALTRAFAEGDPRADVKIRTLSAMAGWRLGK
jgi:hypothetical protein